MHISSGDVADQNFRVLMKLTPTKYKELVEAIRKREFPIVVYGPTGSGKTHSILRALGELELRPKYVELSRTTINRPLDPRVVVLTHLYSIRDLENIRYGKNVIIESNLASLSRLSGYRLIKFNKVTERMARRSGIQNFDGNLFSLGIVIPQRRHEIDVFRLLGKIFYKKICVADLSVSDGFVHYSVEPGNSQDARECMDPLDKDAGLSPSSSISFMGSVATSQLAMSNVVLSVEVCKMERYLFANFLHFSNPRDFAEIYDCLSLMDMDQTNIVTFVQCMKEKDQVGRGFYSFTLETGCVSDKRPRTGSTAETLDFLL